MKRFVKWRVLYPIEEKWRENKLSWFGHIYRRSVDGVVKRVDRIVLSSNAMGRGRPKLTLDVAKRKDTSLRLSEQVALDGAQWEKRIHIVDPN